MDIATDCPPCSLFDYNPCADLSFSTQVTLSVWNYSAGFRVGYHKRSLPIDGYLSAERFLQARMFELSVDFSTNESSVMDRQTVKVPSNQSRFW